MNIKIFLINNEAYDLVFEDENKFKEAVKKVVYDFKNSKTVEFYNNQKQVYINSSHVVKIEVEDGVN